MHSQTEGLRWRAPIARWAAWEARVDTAAAPDVGFIEPMLRRRLGRLAKMALRVAHDCAQDLPRVRFVFASRHGDLTRTTALLDDLAAGEALSPTAFSLSVLNASAGLFSILRGDTAPATAIAAARSSFGFGLLEAATQLADDPGTPVLLVYADEPAPAIYGDDAASTGPAHALALLLADGAAPAPIHLDCRLESSAAAPDEEPHSLAFLRSLEHTGAGEHTGGAWVGEGRRWSWRSNGNEDGATR